MNHIQTYDEAFKFLLEFVDYEKVTKFKYDLATFNLKRVEELMAAVGNPHRAFRSVHVAGTKGKGSTSAMTQSILTAAGFRTGLFTSPHLCRLEERMMIDGRMMPEAELVGLINELAAYTRRARSEWPNESPTFFELVTAAGFRYFARQKVDFGVIEVGMGGRLDATNVVLPEVSVVTRIDYDHVERLGHTLAKIAGEKAGIIKPSVPVVCAPQEGEALEAIAGTAAQRGCRLTLVGREYKLDKVETGLAKDGPFCRFDLAGPSRRYEGLTLRLLGSHQATNAATAVAALEILQQRHNLRIAPDAIRSGLESTRIPARLETIPGRPLTLLDGAHNPISMRALCETLDKVFRGKRVVLLMGVSRDKDAAEMLKLILPRAAAVVFTRSDSPRAEEPEALVTLARETCGVEAEACGEAGAALERARELAGADDLICITGSFYLAGKLRPSLVESAT